MESASPESEMVDKIIDAHPHYPHQPSSQSAGVKWKPHSSPVRLITVSLVAGLFGGRIVAKSPHPHYVSAAIGVALVAFALSVLAIVVVLKPQKMKWEFAQNLTSYFEDLAAGEPIQAVDVTFNLAKDFEASRIQNKVVLESLYWWFNGACLLVGIQVVAWGVSVF